MCIRDSACTRLPEHAQRSLYRTTTLKPLEKAVFACARGIRSLCLKAETWPPASGVISRLGPRRACR
eukprot:7907377-Alexandrium_andersonii.AAC.1